jgi:dienelactone hydrolase
MTWFYHHNNSIRSEPKVRSFFEAEKEENASLPLGGAGFCWGGYAVFALARDPESPMDVGFTAHPSGLELPKDAERLKKPMSIAAPEHDNRIKEKDRKEIEGAFKKSEDLKWELKVYKDATHGFAVRGELLRETKEQATEAEEQASSWFIERFKEVKL